jgi:TldD protein
MNEQYTELFGVSYHDLRKVLSLALSDGGDYADIFFEYSLSNDLTLRDGEVNSVNSNIDYGAGIRVLSGEKTGYAYSEQTSLEQLYKAAKAAARISSQRTGIQEIPSNLKPVSFPNRYPILSSYEDHSITEKKMFLLKLNSAVFNLDKRVIKVIVKLSDVNSRILFYNSLGEICTDERPLSSLVVTCIMQDGSKIENSTSTRSYMKGFEFLSEALIKEMAEEVVKECSILFEASQPKGGEMAVVMGAGGSGILLHEAIGHAFEADFIRKKVSIFSDKLGTKICNSDINIVDDGTIMGNRGAVNVDDEGIPGQKTYMVKNGILNSFLHDRISAKHYNTSPTGNGRRESFRFMPIPRMRATYMEGGNSTEENLIKEVKKGIYVDKFSNGQVQIGAGDFTFFVKSGFLIENGTLTKPVKDINIIGNGPEALGDIIAVANNPLIDNGTWTCGKEQYCPVSCGMPSVLIKKLTVGGIN